MKQTVASSPMCEPSCSACQHASLSWASRKPCMCKCFVNASFALGWGSDLFSPACLSLRPLAGTCWPNPHSFLHPDPSLLDLLAGCVLHKLPPTFGFSVLGLECFSWLGVDQDHILNSLRVFWPESWWDHLSPFNRPKRVK